MNDYYNPKGLNDVVNPTDPFFVLFLDYHVPLVAKAIRLLMRASYFSFPKPHIDESTFRRLYHIYQEEIEKLEALIQRDLSIWKQKKCKVRQGVGKSLF